MPGRFMRASLPRPSTSCAGTIESTAGDAERSSISDQCGSAGSRPGRRARLRAERVPPADGRLGVVRARVDDEQLHVVLGPVRVARTAAEAELQHDHAGQAELQPQPLDGRRDHAEILGNQGERAELAPRRVERVRCPALVASGPRARCGRARAPTSRRRSRGSDRCGPGRRAGTRGAGARSTSGSPGAVARASRRAGCPTAARSR